MSFSAAEKSLLRLTRAPIIREPFDHIYVRDVFPADFYAEMLANIPDVEAFGDYALPRRRIVDPQTLGPFWTSVWEWMGTTDYILPLISKFSYVRKPEHIGFNIRLVRDDPDYSLSPHTDHPDKFASFLFYLPPNDKMREFGTTLLRHQDPEFTHHGLEWIKDQAEVAKFRPVFTAPFMPNTCFAFPRTSRSFHCVMPSTCGQVRHALLLNLGGSE